jgi:acetyl-CoA C-acetyltransferase
MPEAVIVDSVRTPIGRAFKGSLKDLRPDETAAFIIDALLERNEGVDPTLVEDVYMGCGLPQGLQANNIGRIAVLLSKHLTQQTNGVTVSRYCASSLETIRLAANNVIAGQGDAYIAGGVEFVSRFTEAQEAARPQDQNEHLQGKNPGEPDAYIAMGLTAENVAERYNVSREDQDAFAKQSQDRAVAAQEAGVFEREIAPVPLPDGSTLSKDEGPRPGTTVEKLATLKPAFREGGTVTAGNACPLNDGAAATLIMSADEGQGARPQAARPHPHRRHLGQRARVHGRRADRRDPQGARPGRHDDRRRRRLRAQRGVRRAGPADRRRDRLRHGQAQPARRRDRPRPSRSG